MQSVGEMLRSEREKQNRDLSAISAETCITIRYLQAIEEDNLKALPGDFFYKNFVKQYANALEMDYAAVEQELARSLPPTDIDPLPALSASYQIAKVEGRIPLFPRQKPWIIGLLVVVMAGCSAISAVWLKRQHPNEPVEMARMVTLPVAQPAVQVPPPEIHSPPVEPPPSEAKPEAKIEPSKVSLDLSAKERTWVSLTSNGRTIFRGMLARSQTKVLDNLQNAKLTTRNAAGLDVRWNGKPIGPLGKHGQVRVVVFTPENYRILSRRKM